MTARPYAAVASAAAATALAAVLAFSGRAESAQVDIRAGGDTVRERARGAVEDCSTRSGIGGLREYRSRWNLVVGPLAMKGAGGKPVHFAADFGGQKVPVLVRGGHRVTLELSRDTRRGAGLAYGALPEGDVYLRHAHRVVTFIACRRGEITNDIVDGWPVTGWSGAVLARSPRCVPLLVWVDDEPRPHRAVIHLGVRHCG